MTNHSNVKRLFDAAVNVHEKWLREDRFEEEELIFEKNFNNIDIMKF